MTVAGFIQPTDSTQVLFVEIAALRAQRQGMTDANELQAIQNRIGQLSAQIRKIRADEIREKE